MTINIFADGELTNRIVADEAFAQDYCARHGYTYEIEPTPPEPEPEKTYTAEEMIAALLGNNSSGGGVKISS